MVMQLLHWTMATVVCPVLRHFFYVTDFEGTSNELFYFSRPVWNAVT